LQPHVANNKLATPQYFLQYCFKKKISSNNHALLSSGFRSLSSSTAAAAAASSWLAEKLKATVDVDCCEKKTLFYN
jgi:hypothetical protein